MLIVNPNLGNVPLNSPASTDCTKMWLAKREHVVKRGDV